MSAETGVGPSIASGSQMCSGNCADLPTAPENRPSVKPVSTALPIMPWMARSLISAMPSTPVFDQMSSTASRNAKSPKRVTMNAFFAAAAADGRSNQNPISRYEARPTSSQCTNSWSRFEASTSPSIAAVNSDIDAK